MTLPAAGPALRAETSKPTTNDRFSPARIIEVELTKPLPRLDFDGQYRRAGVLARLHTEPVGVCIVTLKEEGVSPNQLAALLWRDLNEPVVKRFVAAELTEPVALTGEGLKAEPDVWPFLRRRSAILADAPFFSVIASTTARNRASSSPCSAITSARPGSSGTSHKHAQPELKAQTPANARRVAQGTTYPVNGHRRTSSAVWQCSRCTSVLPRYGAGGRLRDRSAGH